MTLDDLAFLWWAVLLVGLGPLVAVFAVFVKREICRSWSELLDGAAIETR